MNKLLGMILVIIVSMTSIAFASVEKFEGIGEYYLSQVGNIHEAEDIAFQEAMRSISQQVVVVIRSNTAVEKNQLTDDEVEMATSSVIHVKNKKIDIEKVECEDFKIKITVEAEVDIDEAKEMAMQYFYKKSKTRIKD